MASSFRKSLENNHGLLYRNGIYYQNAFLKNGFEQPYTQLREKEGRLYPNDVVKLLPDISSTHPLKHEWLVRRNSADRVIRFLKKNHTKSVLEVGCGNGWLIHRIQMALNCYGCGIDVNETELLQAVEVFGTNDQLQFIYGDICSDIFHEHVADAIVIASALQYFPEPSSLISKMLTLLKAGGAIHILDTPFYHPDQIEQARLRSHAYFLKSEQPAMVDQYFHHSWTSLEEFNFRLLHDPRTLSNKLSRPFNHNSPFPWVLITR